MRGMLLEACLLGLGAGLSACATTITPPTPMAWQRVPSNFGSPVWIASPDLKGAQAAWAKGRRVEVLVPGPLPKTEWNPEAAYSIAFEDYDCEGGLAARRTTYFDTAGGVIQQDPTFKPIDILPGTTRATIYGVICQGDPIAGEAVELIYIPDILAYPRPQRSPPHP